MAQTSASAMIMAGEIRVDEGKDDRTGCPNYADLKKAGHNYHRYFVRIVKVVEGAKATDPYTVHFNVATSFDEDGSPRFSPTAYNAIWRYAKHVYVGPPPPDEPCMRLVEDKCSMDEHCNCTCPDGDCLDGDYAKVPEKRDAQQRLWPAVHTTGHLFVSGLVQNSFQPPMPRPPGLFAKKWPRSLGA